MLPDHPVLGPDYERGLDAGRQATPGVELTALPLRLGERERLLWSLLVESPLREEAGTLLELATESRELSTALPALRQRAYDEGFAEALRERVRTQLTGPLKPPARWAGVLRQSTHGELAAMLQVLPRCRTWTEFFTRYHRAWELTSTSRSST